MNDFPLNGLQFAHHFIASHVRPGAFCIDATAGRGRDTVLLCGLSAPAGRVLAMDIQPAAVAETAARVAEAGYGAMAEVVCASHDRMAEFAAPASVDCIVFNFGWLPGGDHRCFTRAETSIPAIRTSLSLLRPDGLMSLCIYSGGANGYAERDAILQCVESLDPTQFTVVVSRYANRTGDPPIPVCIVKHG